MATIIRQSYIDKIERYLGKETVIVSCSTESAIASSSPVPDCLLISENNILTLRIL